MNEIKFRGVALVNTYNLQNYPNIKEEWVYGYYVKVRGHHYILQAYNNSGYDERWETAGWIEVHPASVGRYAGFKDRKGVEIYEGALLDYIWCGKVSYTGRVEFMNGALKYRIGEVTRNINAWAGEIEVVG